MAEPIKVKRRKILMNKLKHKYRLVFFNDNTFEEVWHLRLSALNVLAVVGITSFVMVTLVIGLMAFTPLRELIPGYPDEQMKRAIYFNKFRLDSLEYQLKIRDQYFANFNALISGAEPIKYDSLKQEKSRSYKDIKFTRSVQDSLFRERIEDEEQFNISVDRTPKTESSIAEMHFFPPVKGLITASYSSKENHLGIDIVGAPNEVVKATLDGTVILSTWTLETGYIIQVQHRNNLVSVYKHNANLLKKAGDVVKAGDAIAIIGNSGELTTGPHLHFELWLNGKPVNPQDYIIFN